MMMARNLNREIVDNDERRYVYSFDYDVIHPFLIKSFEPFFSKGSLLELGSYKGEFTRRLLPYFDDVTCVEGSSDAIIEAIPKLGDKITFMNDTFEKVTLPKRYENIV
jgi:hypothetical protein